MASAQKYLNHLLQSAGITPACSEEERGAAMELARIFANHGFEPEVQEFSASSTGKIVQAALGIMLFIGAVLMGIPGTVGLVGLLLVIAAAALFVTERTGRTSLSSIGAGGLSQNVIAYHKASGPLASPRNRPVVVVAHYDSPRVDLLSQEPFATYRPLLVKLLPYAMMAPIVIAVIRLFPIPDGAKVVLWLLSIAAALVPLANAVAIIATRFVLPYTSGAVCNKSSVAALLGVMDAVSPYEGENEFPDDVPFEEYMAEQEEIAAAMLAALEAAEEEPAEVEGELSDAGEEAEDEEPDTGEVPMPDETASMDAHDLAGDAAADETSLGATQAMDMTGLIVEGEVAVDDEVDADGMFDGEVADEDDSETPSLVNAAGNIRHGVDAIRSLGMLSASCKLVYEDDEPIEAPVDSESDDEEQLDIEYVAADDFEETYEEQPEEVDGASDEVAEEESFESEDDSASELFEFEGEPEPESEFAFDDAILDGDDLPEFEVELAPDLEPEPEELVAESDGEGEVSESEPVPTEDEANATQVFEMPAASFTGATQAMPAQQSAETVDSLMAQIDAAVPQRTIRQIPPVVPDASALQAPLAGNRSAIFDIPDPSDMPNDPFAAPAEQPAPSRNGFTVIGPNDPVPASPTNPAPAAEAIQTISAPAPEPEKPKRGLARLFGRKKKKRQDSMSEWLGVDENFDAKQSGGEIGSWENFNSDDKGWKGGAAGAEGVTVDELRDAITSLGDDELLGHDIWFVATGASEYGNAGMKAFFNTHRDKLRGVFLINLESVGAGRVTMLSTEGEERVLKGDKRIMKLVSRVSSDFHNEFGAVDMPFITTDAQVAMSMSLRSLTLAGVDATHLACSHSEEDQPFNVDAGNVQMVADVVTEVIRRS